MSISLRVIREARECRECESRLPLGAGALVTGSARSRIVIIGQAPGRAAHESGVPWNDPSGVRLRGWMGISEEEFHDERLVSLLPMGFCYPGRGKSGDLPPRPECAPMWHDRILAGLTGVELRIYIGRYAIGRYLGREYGSITGAVRDWESLLPGAVVLPHPSGRNNRWLKQNPWFERETVAALRARVGELVGEGSGERGRVRGGGGGR